MVRAAQQRRALWRVVGYVYGARRRNSAQRWPLAVPEVLRLRDSVLIRRTSSRMMYPLCFLHFQVGLGLLAWL